MSRTDRESIGRVAFAALAIVAAVALTSCGGTALDKARSGLAVTARAVAAADGVAADVIERRFAEVETAEQLERERERADRVVRAFTSAHVVLVAADVTMDAVESDGSWQDSLACVIPAVLKLVDALELFGLDDAVTEPLRFAVGVLSQFLDGECRAP